MPWGEVLAEQKAAEFSTPYQFNGKELDQETGLYNYGARYYDASLSVFPNIDRFADKFPRQSPYTYAGNNPVKFIEVNGDSIDISTLAKIDSKLKAGMIDGIINDSEHITGLNLSINDGNLVYAKDAAGNPISSGGSEEARNLLVSAISNTNTITIGYNRNRSYSSGNGIVLSNNHIDDFIGGTSSDLDKRTMGYGMTFLHEVDHSPVGSGHTDHKTIGQTGPVVDRMNMIRGQLGFMWGQRLSYPSYQTSPGSKTSYLPFNSFSKSSLDKGLVPATSRIRINR